MILHDLHLFIKRPKAIPRLVIDKTNGNQIHQRGFWDFDFHKWELTYAWSFDSHTPMNQEIKVKLLRRSWGQWECHSKDRDVWIPFDTRDSEMVEEMYRASL